MELSPIQTDIAIRSCCQYAFTSHSCFSLMDVGPETMKRFLKFSVIQVQQLFDGKKKKIYEFPAPRIFFHIKNIQIAHPKS